MGKGTPCGWCCSSISQGQSTWQSSVHPSLMPGLVAIAVLYLVHKKVKSNPGNTRGGRPETETCIPPFHPDMTSAPQHGWAIDTQSLPTPVEPSV